MGTHRAFRMRLGRGELVGLLCVLLLSGTGCTVQIDSAGGVEVVTASDIERGTFNVGLSPEDEEGEIAEEASATTTDDSEENLSEEGVPLADADENPTGEAPPAGLDGTVAGQPGEWIAETASGAASLVNIPELSVSPFTDVVPQDTVAVTVAVETAGQPLTGGELRVQVVAPSGATSELVEGLDLPSEATGYADLTTDPLEEAGTYIFRSTVFDNAGKQLAQGPELTLAVASDRLPMVVGKLASVLRKAARYRYRRHSCSTRGCMMRTGRGDCWAMSDFLHWAIERVGIKARILQYRTKASRRHRSVQYKLLGKWRDVPYKLFGISRNFRSTKRRPGLFIYRK